MQQQNINRVIQTIQQITKQNELKNTLEMRNQYDNLMPNQDKNVNKKSMQKQQVQVSSKVIQQKAKQNQNQQDSINLASQNVVGITEQQQNVGERVQIKQQKYQINSATGNTKVKAQSQKSKYAQNSSNKKQTQRQRSHRFELGHQLVYNVQNQFADMENYPSQKKYDQNGIVDMDNVELNKKQINKQDASKRSINGQKNKYDNVKQDRKYRFEYQQNDGKWEQYLKQAFTHYCKSTYATGRHPTFDRIQSVTRCLNINTFKSLCRDFQIQLSRMELMHIFKKATHFGSEMNFNQFMTAFQSISAELHEKQIKQSNINNSHKNQHQIDGLAKWTNNKNTITHQNSKKQEQSDRKELYLNQLIRIMHMHSGAAFHNKMVQLDIRNRKHGVNAYQNLIKLKTQSEYKFKIASLNGKNVQQVEEQLMMRRNMKNQNKQIQKHVKNRKKQIQQAKFTKMNKISASQKKLTQGGYISPPKQRNIIQTGKTNQFNLFDQISNKSWVLSRINMNPQQSSNSKMDQHKKNSTKHIPQLSQLSSMQSHLNSPLHTQLNTQLNTMKNSQIQLKQPPGYGYGHKNKLILSRDIGGTNYEAGSPKDRGYLNNFRNKSSKHTQYNYNGIKNTRNPYELNPILKQAKNKYVYKQYLKTQNGSHHLISQQNYSKEGLDTNLNKPEINSKIKINDIAHNQIVKNRVKTEMVTVKGIPKQQNSIQDLIGVIQDQDQFLTKHLSLHVSANTAINTKLKNSSHGSPF